ncbi:cytochrome C oxidase subunit IV family protein [Patulibacter brassicae]|uniref:Cytochrome C oxidase subunit IV family protein n=1 Tax=Patulibacter brassicae TaxID=1705717 RepID=A0ABU4VPJ2_9ACTN|nr:cytochrome C oxidase subunit IV family protein [Patulibacter brassicae]MDX8153772.1 cytochrome C oxidase subunit IV family protein [Patulibacter brassicae]
MPSVVQVLRSPLGLAWLVLVGATVVSAVLGWGQGGGEGTGSAILAISFLKAYLVGDRFMEVHAAPAWLRLVLLGYCAGVGGALIALLLLL